MRKNWWIIFSLILLLVCMTGCSIKNEENTNDVQGKETIVSIQEKSINSTGLVLIIKNETDDCAFQFDNAYSLEEFVDDHWNTVEKIRDVAVTADAHMLLPGESVECTVKWENRYGSLPTGEYRLVKRIEILQDDGDDYNDLIDNYHMYVSFSL